MPGEFPGTLVKDMRPTLLHGWMPRFAPVFLAALAIITAPAASQESELATTAYPKRLEVHGVPIQATAAVEDEYLYIAARVYEHMTERSERYDLRALHRSSGFRILLIHPDESFLSLPEYQGEDAELDEAAGLGGCIGEFFITLRVGSPHVLIHELGHGIYHSAIQFQETGGATDERAWYAARVKEVLGLDFSEVENRMGEGELHEVLLAEEGTFSADLAACWRNATEEGLWSDEYAGTEPNEYWAEGVALWFRASRPVGQDSRSLLRERDPMLFALCEGIFPDTAWEPSHAKAVSPSGVSFQDESEEVLRAVTGPADLGDLVRFLDRDQDGLVEAYEGAEALLYLTAEADSSGDGALSILELGGYLEQQKRDEQSEGQQIFEELDQDRDGLLSVDEIPEEFLALVEVMDVDGDGAVSLAELLETDALDDPTLIFEQELLGFLHEFDADGDGALSLKELPLPERMEFSQQFSALDSNNDKLLEERELLALLEEEMSGATYEVRGEDAVMTGVIGPSTPGRTLQLILEHPEVDCIVMEDVPGSMDDDSNIRAARIVRQGRLDTHVPQGGEVASGGTDFFQAGVRRTRGEGARFGVHSWSGGVGEEGAEIPRDDPEHLKYLEYYREMGIPDEFYWYTLEAASADDIHWMTNDELARYSMLTEDEPSDHDGQRSELLGGCILREPRAEAPEKLRQVTPVMETSEYGPLPKMVRACGIVLAAEGNVPDSFLELVGETIGQIFAEFDGCDSLLQERVLTHLYAYRALLPVPRGEDSFERIIRSAPDALDRLQRENSLCDIIMAEVPEGQVMEVIEHILHAISDVGLHYEFPDEWGISRESELWKAMQLAIERGHYQVESYDDLKRHESTEIYERILLQEFAYWFISTAWELQVDYGPNESEWTIRDRAELTALYPEFFEIYEDTVGRVMRAPDVRTLKRIGPTRAEERSR